MLNKLGKFHPRNIFRELTNEEKKSAQERLDNAKKRIEELKDSARKLVACPEFQEFRKDYVEGRESLIGIFKGIDPSEFGWEAKMIQVQSDLILLDGLLGIEKKGD